MTFDEIGIEEVYNHESLEDVVEMRPDHEYDAEVCSICDCWMDEQGICVVCPESDSCYVGPDLRDNEDRSLVGLPDWQSDFPSEF